MEFSYARVTYLPAGKPFGFAVIVDEIGNDTAEQLYFHIAQSRFTRVKDDTVVWAGHRRFVKNPDGTPSDKYCEQAMPEVGDFIAYEPSADTSGKRTRAESWCAEGVVKESQMRLEKILERKQREAARQASNAQPAATQSTGSQKPPVPTPQVESDASVEKSPEFPNLCYRCGNGLSTDEKFVCSSCVKNQLDKVAKQFV